MATLEKAIEIAARAHAGGRDKAGEPYILHPLRVMIRLATEEARVVAIIHDVLEDTSVTREDLLSAGFSEEIVQAIEAVTRRPGELYESLLRRAVANLIARQVKMADVTDNLDPERLGRLPAEVAARLRTKYASALAILQEADCP